MPKINVGILVSGRGSNMDAIIRASEEGKIDAVVAAVVSDKADAPALEKARRKNIPAFHVDPKAYPDKDLYEQEIIRIFHEHKIDLVCMAGYMRIASKVLLDEFRYRVMNIHPSILPSFPGLHVQKRALDWGAKLAGCTVHFTTSELDMGPIICQGVVEVKEDDSEQSLSIRILEQEHKIYPKAVQLFAQGRLKVDGRKVRILPEK